VARASRWSPEERRVLDSYVLALARGKFPSRAEAARALSLDLDRLRRRYPGAVWLKPGRTLHAIRRTMQKRRSTLRLPPERPPWTAKESRILDRYASRVAHSRSYEGTEATRDYLRYMAELRRSHPDWLWLRQRRTYSAVEERLRVRSHELGRPYVNVAFSPEEDEVLSRYARDVLAGRYSGIKAAAIKARPEILRLHRMKPLARWAEAERNHSAIWKRIALLANELGRSRPGSRWMPEEDRIVERYARAVAAGRDDARQAAGKCWQVFARRRSGGARRKGRIPWAAAHRTLRTVRNRIASRAHELGWGTQQKPWSPEETAIVRRWAKRYALNPWRRDADTGQTPVQLIVAELARRGYQRTANACLLRVRLIRDSRIKRPR